MNQLNATEQDIQSEQLKIARQIIAILMVGFMSILLVSQIRFISFQTDLISIVISVTFIRLGAYLYDQVLYTVFHKISAFIIVGLLIANIFMSYSLMINLVD